MAILELVVIGKDPGQRWRRHIPEDRVVRLGRAPENGWAIGWDRCISREQCDLEVRGNEVLVRCTDQARNPLNVDGQFVRECTVAPGGEFRIGETLFQINSIEFSTADVATAEERTFDSDDVKQYAFDDSDNRLEVLAKLPEVIANSLSDDGLARNLVRMLLAGTPHADVAAVVRYDMSAGRDTTRPLALQWDGQPGFTGRFQPSRRLIMTAIDEKKTKLHLWFDVPGGVGSESFTFSASLDWAFCTPIIEPACAGWCLYLSGKISARVRNADDLKPDIRFTELLAQTTGALRQVSLLERHQSEMSQFFSPAVVAAISTRSGTAAELLAPRVLPTTVLFCDLRGFSRQAEKSTHDLHNLLARCSRSLGLMTKNIFAFDGVVADFQGDAALGFWGWPIAPDDGPLQGCRAALKILADFQKAQSAQEHGELENFRVGIGIAHGEAIAGKIGTEQQAKVGVFGPVVNLGSRLEGLTKHLRVPILIDEVTAQFVRERLPSESGRCRRLARLQPYGLETPVTVYQLLPAVGADPLFTDEYVANYELAVDAVIEGDWEKAFDMLANLPVEDRAKDFLLEAMARYGYNPPPDWNGVIVMESK